MKVHTARSETKLVDGNENKHKISNRGQSYIHCVVVPRETEKKTESCKQGRDRNEGRKVEGRGVRKTKGRRGSRRGKERTRSARKY